MSDVCNNCKNCGNAILEMPMGDYKCYVKKRSCTRQEIDIGGCGDWSEKRTVEKKENKPTVSNTQTKSIDIVENGIIEITPDEGYVLSKVTVNTNVPNDRSIEDSIISRGIVTYSNEQVSSIGGQAFYGCSKLKTVYLPNVETIASNGFRNCSSLLRVDLGVKARIINSNCFNGCSKLSELIIRYDNVCTLASSTSLVSTAIESGTGYVYVPSTLVSAYKSATNWSKYVDQIRAIEDYPEICG